MEQKFTSLKPTADLPRLHAILAARAVADRQGQGWYSITNLSQTEAEVVIYDEIGMYGVTAGDFINAIRDIKASTITLRINSPGGDVFDGIAIFNAIARHPATVNVYVDGIAASAASFIVQAGDMRTMMPHSQMMIHDAHGLVMGPADDMRRMADVLDMNSNNIASIYASRAGGTVEEWRAKMREETWFDDVAAVRNGLADRIEGMDSEALLEAEIVDDPDPEPEPDPPAPPDYAALFDEIVEGESDAIFGIVVEEEYVGV